MFTIYVTYKGSDRDAVEGFYKEIREIGIDILSRKEDGNVRYEYYWPAPAVSSGNLGNKRSSADTFTAGSL